MSRIPAASPASTIDTYRRLTSFDVRPQLGDDFGQILGVRLLLEDDERADDVQAGLDHRRELPREDLQRFRLYRLEDAADAFFPACRQLVELPREQPADAQLLTRCGGVWCVDLARQLEALGVDRRVGEGGHAPPLSDGGRGGLRDSCRMPIR